MFLPTRLAAGSVDVIVVEQENGELKSSPFHVRFGKLGEWRPKNRAVEFWVNDIQSTIPMMLNELGEAYFSASTDLPRTQSCYDFRKRPLSNTQSAIASLDTQSPSSSIIDRRRSIDQPTHRSPSPRRRPSNNHRFRKSISTSEPRETSVVRDKISISVPIPSRRKRDMRDRSKKSISSGNESGTIANLRVEVECVVRILDDGTEIGKSIDQQRNKSISKRNTKPIRHETEDRNAMSDTELDDRKRVDKVEHRKTLTSDELKSLKLLPDVANKARFLVTTKYRGTTTVECEIWLWRHDDKIVISDIDGTITKSDFWGHVLPWIGVSYWTHKGVAKLYDRVASNGYKFLYLSNRPIGMASRTRRYLKSVRQDNYCLPRGPLLVSLFVFVRILYMELIEKWRVMGKLSSEIFKTNCLRDVAALFESNRFAAGFGNRAHDAGAYVAAGVPANAVFIIDSLSHIVSIDCCWRSYLNLYESIDKYLPAVENR